MDYMHVDCANASAAFVRVDTEFACTCLTTDRYRPASTAACTDAVRRYVALNGGNFVHGVFDGDSAACAFIPTANSCSTFYASHLQRTVPLDCER